MVPPLRTFALPATWTREKSVKSRRWSLAVERGRGCYVHNKCDHPECKKANAEYQRVKMRDLRRGQDRKEARESDPRRKFKSDDPMRKWL